MVPDEMKFETFVDAQSTAFQEYVSAIIAKLPKSNKEYKAIQDEIKAIYEPVSYTHLRAHETF